MSYSEKDGKKLSVSKNNHSLYGTLSQFLKNDHHSFVVQKTEKLASALYIVTGFIPQDDPLRGRLRTCAIEMVSCSVNPPPGFQDIAHHDRFTSRCMEVMTILGLAEKAGMVSPMNAKILCDEYGSLASFVRAHSDKVFVPEGLGEESTKTSMKAPLPYKTQSKGHKESDIKDTDTNKDSKVSDKKSDRKSKILELFNLKDKITIADAIEAVPDCSDKTVQRELIDLVQEGVLIKEGERRWSTYRRAF